MAPLRACLCVALALLALAARAEEDGENCKDHPLFSRMPNHYIYRCEHSQFEMRRYPVGPLDKDNRARLKELEGEYWLVQYAPNEGAVKPSGLQIQRNFQNAARAAGGSVEGSYPPWCSFELDESFAQGNSCTNHGTTLRIAKGGRETWTFVNAVNEGYTLMILEVQAMKQDVSVNEMVDRLNKDGFLTLYVNFDTGKATIRPDSDRTLDEAAAVLKAASTLRIEVAGHTDNVGGAAGNEKLSADRAQSVMAALAKRGIAASRLTAKGYGQSVPIADNRSEEGRAKNRRVELVRK